jgi:hypothetical protein
MVREVGVRHLLALLILFGSLVSSDAATLRERLRLAQAHTPDACIANCSATNFSYAKNCGLSGACVAQCTVDADACKSRCASPK